MSYKADVSSVSPSKRNELLKRRAEEQGSCGQFKNTGYGSQDKAKAWVIMRTNSQFCGICC